MSSKQHEPQPPPELVARVEAEEGGACREGDPLAGSNLHPTEPAEKPEPEPSAAETEAEMIRWRTLAIRAFAVLSFCENSQRAMLELAQGWVCFACGASGSNPRPYDCPVCESGGTAGNGTLPGTSATHEALQIARGRPRVRAPQEDQIGQAEAPDGRREIEIARFCPLCRASVPPEIRRPEDCPSCKGRGAR